MLSSQHHGFYMFIFVGMLIGFCLWASTSRVRALVMEGDTGARSEWRWFCPWEKTLGLNGLSTSMKTGLSPPSETTWAANHVVGSCITSSCSIPQPVVRHWNHIIRRGSTLMRFTGRFRGQKSCHTKTSAELFEKENGFVLPAVNKVLMCGKKGWNRQQRSPKISAEIETRSLD